MNLTSRHPAHLLAALAIALPWLNPFAMGPSPPVVQWLFTLACAGLLLGLMALRLLDGRGLARAAALGWLLAALVSSAFGVLQYFGLSPALSPWVNVTVLGEAYANLRQRNQFATLTNIGLAALLWWAAQRPLPEEPGHDDGPAHQWPCLLMAALLALGNATSSSRTGMVQLLLLGGLALAWRSSARDDAAQPVPRFTLRLVLVLVAVAVYGLALLALPRLAGLDAAEHGLLARLAEGDGVCVSRITLWRNVLYLIAQKPWFGWGWGELDYAHYITLYPGPRFCDILDNAHNLPLQLAVELGVPASLLLCALAAVLTLRARPWREADPIRRVAWAVLAVNLLHSLLEYPLWYGPFLMAALLCLQLLARPAPAGLGRPLALRSLQGAAAAALLGLVLFMAWDYRRISQIFLPPEQRAAAYQTDTLAKLQGSWWFHQQVEYAELTTATVTPANAAELQRSAQALLHFSPEARVIEKLIESAVQLGLDDVALTHMQRYRAAFPEDYAQWLKAGNPVRSAGEKP